jgi:hypothetical protein
MDTNQIKKALYKEKPIARLTVEDADGYNYSAFIESTQTPVGFFVPYSDMGTSRHRFKDEMPAQELIRWLQKPDYI